MNKIWLTIPQLDAFLNMRKKNYWEWGRGSGKSTALAYAMLKMVSEMPGASFALVGVTYAHIKSKTLPSTKEGLRLFNFHQDIDYVVGTCGKKLGFAMPLQSPDSWHNIIHFSNGAIFQMVSLDDPNSGRGLNAYAVLADEAALLDEVRLYNNVKTTNRAKKARFSKSIMLGSETYVSSTPVTKKGKWFIEKELDFIKGDPTIYYSKSNAFFNPHVRPEWFVEMEKEAPSRLIYEAEFLNIRPKEITDGFYANLNPDKHYEAAYDEELVAGQLILPKSIDDCRRDTDLNRKAPLIVSLDFGVFNTCLVMQQDRTRNRINVLKDFWVKSPKLLDDLFIEKFLPYYEPHQEKVIHLYGGHDGNNRLPNSSRTLFGQVEDILRQHGWRVHLLSRGAAATHADKYLLVNAMLKEHNPKLAKIRINKHNCADLIVSLERSEAKEGKGGVEKDKKDERNKSVLQQHATHLADAFDIPLMALYNDIFKASSNLTAGESPILLY